MKILMIIFLGFLALVILSFIVSMALYIKEQNAPDQEEEKLTEAEMFNRSMISMCLRARQAKVCPNDCSICAYGQRMHDNVVEFRGKK